MTTEPARAPSSGAPLVVVLSGQSGAGKDTVLRGVLARDPSFATVATVKTRPPRHGEIEGVHHIFLTDAQFDEWLARDAFLEHAEVYGHRSGVPRDQVERLLAEGKSVLLRTDVQGARTLRRRVREAVLVFLAVPDEETLERRMRSRDSEPEPEIQRRLAEAAREAEAAGEFDYVVVNYDDALEQAISDFLAIVNRERQRPGRRAPSV